jgi:hypothetical protein
MRQVPSTKHFQVKVAENVVECCVQQLERFSALRYDVE